MVAVAEVARLFSRVVRALPVLSLEVERVIGGLDSPIVPDFQFLWPFFQILFNRILLHGLIDHLPDVGQVKLPLRLHQGLEVL